MKPIDGALPGGNDQYMDDESPEETPPTEMLGAEINQRREQAEVMAERFRGGEAHNAKQADQWERVARACTAAQKQLMADAQEASAASKQIVNG